MDPNVSRTSSDIADACVFYDDLRQFFTGVQVAGPRLYPANIDQGFHAIPPHPSASAYEPACYYEPGDYTCVKDAISEWWDPTAQNQQVSPANAAAGCWRMSERGRRHRAGEWPGADVTATKRPDDPCNLYVGQFLT